LKELEDGLILKDVAIKNWINYNYLALLWQRKRKELPIKTPRKKIDSIGDFSINHTTEIYRDC